MTPPLIGCIADDYTGATDLASSLARSGLRVCQTFGVPDHANRCPEADAIVIAIKSRSIPAQDAINQSLACLQWLKDAGVRQYYFKYCSTFDSTPQGNIGPVSEALAVALDVNDIIHCPAFPANGRTIDCGHLFVNGVLLHETGMRNHPLNPMRDSHLVRVLQAQSRGSVDSLARGQSPPDRQKNLHGNLVRHWIADAMTDDDLQAIAGASRDRTLLAGASALGARWAEALLKDGKSTAVRDTKLQAGSARRNNGETAAVAILVGSCSEATREQVEEFRRIGPVLPMDVAECSPSTIDESLNWFRTQAASAPAALFTTSSDLELLERSRRRWGASRAAQVAEELHSELARRLAAEGVRTLVVAGGETSGAVVDALEIGSVRVGREIAPGVPWIHTLHPPYFNLALKSGNFGRPQFFRDALEALS